MIYFRIFFLLVPAVLFSCSGDNGKKQQQPDADSVKQQLIRVNKMLAQKESDEIDAYIRRQGWGMKRTGTGLRYVIFDPGKGERAVPGKTAKVNYKISLFDGTVCYSSDSTGAAEFLVEQDNVESGIHEGIQLLNAGGKAKFVLPSHLAHGLLGDENKIPPLSPVVYDIELLEVK